jgi:hypothetical protein
MFNSWAILTLLIIALVGTRSAVSFSSVSIASRSTRSQVNTELLAVASNDNDDDHHMCRRRFMGQALSLASAFAIASSAEASTEKYVPGTLWYTGKEPKIPQGKLKDKGDVSGTKKDPNFLRSLSDCKNQCQNSQSGPDGLAKSKEDCLSECQDICCTTYSQCTFAIVPRI